MIHVCTLHNKYLFRIYIFCHVYFSDKSDELTDLQNSQPKYCTNPECVRAAGNMIQGMDLVMNPCTDFYQFSCGAWVKQNPIPDTSSSWNQFNILREQLSRDVRGSFTVNNLRNVNFYISMRTYLYLIRYLGK